ncbi:hypothetical protein NSB04_06340 [Blautia pseudococcoides]|nr:hypothetical protein [Blautia pseudococcoides]
MKRFFQLCSLITIISLCFALSGCNADSNETELNEEMSNITNAIDDEIPFSVSIDKVSLESKQKKTVTVDIVSEVEKWEYTVEVKSGKISNKTSASFDYTCPNDEMEDTITVYFNDNKTGKKYTCSIPLIFIETTNQNELAK